MSVRVVSGAIAGAVVATAALALAAAPAHAHNVLTTTTPADGATVATVPTAVTMTFDQTVLGLGSGVRVTGPSGDVQDGAAKIVDDTVTQAVSAGAPPGRYTVTWRVTSVDGHPISDSFAFTARAAGAGAPLAAETDAATVDTTPASQEEPDESTPWAKIVVGAVLGTVAGTAYVLVQRRRKARSAADDGGLP